MNSSSLKVAKGNRFERRKQRTRDDLVVAATRVLANKGLQATKITDIAAAADVGVGTFYLHFETKDALYDALVEDAAMCRFARDNREVFKLVFGPAVSHHDVVRRAQAEFARDIEQTIRRGVERGVFGPVPPAIAAQALVGMSTQLLAWWSEHEAVPVEWLNETIDTLTLRGLSPR